MTEANISSSTYGALVVRPFILFCVVVLMALAIINSLVTQGSLTSVKGLLVLIIAITLFVVTTYSWRYFIWIYVGGAILQGFSFLVHPTATEQKLFFSFFYLTIGKLNLYLGDLFLLVSLLTIIVRIPMSIQAHPNNNLLNNLISRFIILFMIIGGFITALSVLTYGKSALGESRTVWYALFFFVSVLYFDSDKKILDFFRIFIYLTLIRSCINFITVFIAPDYLSHERPFGSNADAAFCALSFILLVTLGERLIKDNIIRKIALFCLGIFPILITSRSTLLCLVLSLAVYVLLLKKLSIKKITVFILSTLVLVGISLYVIMSVPQLNDLIGFRFVTLLQNYQDDPTGNWRLLGWLFALNSIINNPLLGIGFGGYAERFVAGQWVKVSLHSAYLDYLYTMGLLGFLPFVGSLFISLKSLMKTVATVNNDTIKSCVTGLFVCIFFFIGFIGLNAEMSYASTGTVMWFFLGMVPYLTNSRPNLL